MRILQIFDPVQTFLETPELLQYVRHAQATGTPPSSVTTSVILMAPFQVQSTSTGPRCSTTSSLHWASASTSNHSPGQSKPIV